MHTVIVIGKLQGTRKGPLVKWNKLKKAAEFGRGFWHGHNVGLFKKNYLGCAEKVTCFCGVRNDSGSKAWLHLRHLLLERRVGLSFSWLRMTMWTALGCSKRSSSADCIPLSSNFQSPGTVPGLLKAWQRSRGPEPPDEQWNKGPQYKRANAKAFKRCDPIGPDPQACSWQQLDQTTPLLEQCSQINQSHHQTDSLFT